MKRRVTKAVSVLMIATLLACGNVGIVFATEDMTDAKEENIAVSADEITADEVQDTPVFEEIIMEDASEEEKSEEVKEITDDTDNPENAENKEEITEEITEETTEESEDESEDELFDKSGYPRNNRVYWEVKGTTLEITGTGKVIHKDGESEPWESDKGKITKVVVGEGITEISGLFQGYSKLSEVSLPSSLKVIGDKTFYDCRVLTTINYPANLITIGSWAFDSCVSLKSVQLSDSIKTIGIEAFNGCNLTGELELPASLDIIDESAFSCNSGITKVTMKKSPTSCARNVFLQCTALKEVIFSPGMTVIPKLELYRSPVETVSIPNGATEIATGAFSGCDKLKNISLPSSLKKIGPEAFYGCELLTFSEIVLPEGLEEIGYRAFVNCKGLTGTLRLPSSLKKLGFSAFESCIGIDKVIYGGSLVGYNGDAFPDCPNLRDVEFVSGTTKIPENACKGWEGIENLVIPEGITEIGEGAYCDCSNIETIQFPSTLRKIGKSAFAGCTKLEELNLPASVVEIGDYAFKNCSKIEELRLPVNLTTAGKSAFYNCNKVKKVYINAKLTTVGFEWLLAVPAEVVFEEGRTTIPDSFLSGASIIKVTISNGVTTIGKYSFNDCESLKTVIMPNTVTTIGKYAFSQCLALESINLSNSLKIIDEGVFVSCKKLENVTIPPSVTSIGYAAFNYCFGLKNLYIPVSVKNIRSSAIDDDHTVDVWYSGTESQWKKISNYGIYSPPHTIHFSKPSTNVTLDLTSVLMYVGGDSINLTATVLPDDASNKSVIWSSSNSKVATVDNDGKVTAVANGTAKITATAADGSGKSASCTVTVKTHVAELALTAAGSRLAIGKTLTVTPVFNGGTTSPQPTDKTLYWWSSDSSIATVTQKGVVKAIGSGTVRIKAVSNDGSVVSGPLEIFVYEPVTAVKLDKTSISTGEGNTFSLKASLTPSDKSDDDEHQGVEFSSNNTIVAVKNVDGNSATFIVGALPASVSKVTAKITATAKDGSGKSAVCTVTVGKAVESVIVSAPNDQKRIAKGSSLKLTAGITPANAMNKTVEWTTSAPGIATVDKKGTVKALAAGNVTITATCVSDREKKDTYDITTYIPVSKVTLNNTSLNLQSGKSYPLVAAVTPADATSVVLSYRIKSGSEYLEVDSNGVVTAKGPESLGTKATQKAVVEVTAEGVDGKKKTATCNVTVTKNEVKVTGLKLNKTSFSMGSDAKETLIVTISPRTATNTDIEWTLDKTGIADITDNKDGTITITAKSEGKVKITAKSKDGSKKSVTCTVTVGRPVESVTVTSKTDRLIVGKTATLSAKVLAAENSKSANTTVGWTVVSAKDTEGVDVDVPSRIATVNTKGVVTAIAAGTVTIRATAETPSEGAAKYGEYTITTYVPVSKITANRTSVSVSEGLSGTILCFVAPDDATDKGLVWTNSNTSAVEILKYENGVLSYKAAGAGTAKLTGTSKDGSKKKITLTIKVIGRMKEDDVGLNVKSIPKGVEVVVDSCGTKSLEVTKMPVKKTLTLKPVLTPTAADKNVTYRSSDPNIATVSSSGVVTAKNTGNTTITMRTSDGGYEAKCLITVTAK